ncbi:hypothetical protein RclHR1_00920018 [Rhizophagus clarus]|uniref:Uncharacterized protein n=1 Tax=Rhizophagus clarus TaxID=94130 RepID=A0A2Z6SH09_9GLOM|nr:hypothetical protein RclHR1_00920018 [Rhizophagus clarus]
MQSELDSLKQRVIELLAENAEIKAENAEVKAENAKLRQAMEENEARFVKLEQSDKEKAELIAELNCDVGKIKQEQIAINVSVQDGTSVVKSPTRSELQVTSQSSISPPIEGNSENSSDVTQPTHAGSKLLEDRQTDEFLISVSKKEVSDMMRQRNREKKLLRGSTYSSQDQDELSIFQNNSSMPLEDSVETETNTSSSQSSIKLSVCGTGEAQVLPKDTKVSHDYIVAQDFIQEVSSELIDEDDVQVIDGNQELTTDMTIEVELAHLFLEVSIEGKNTTQARQKEISCRYSYGKRFEESVQEIIARDNVSDQTARKQLFQDIIKHLSGITLETLRKRTQRAIKIYKLFEKIGVDRIKNIKSYSADSISKFTKHQIQIILNYFGGSCYADAEIKKPNSYSECKDIEKVRPKVPLEKSQGSVPKKLPDVKISTPPTSQTSKANQTNALEVQEKYLDSVEVSTSANVSSSGQSNPTYNRTYFRNKILDQYSNLYRECSIENFDYYGITDETTCGDYICPLCKLGHDDEEIEGTYNTGSYFIKCEQRKIEIVA